MPEEDEDFQTEIPDMKVMPFFTVGREEEWRGMRCDVNIEYLQQVATCKLLLWGESSDFVMKKNKYSKYPRF
jgi:hypothetical protein